MVDAATITAFAGGVATVITAVCQGRKASREAAKAGAHAQAANEAATNATRAVSNGVLTNTDAILVEVRELRGEFTGWTRAHEAMHRGAQ